MIENKKSLKFHQNRTRDKDSTAVFAYVVIHTCEQERKGLD